MRPPNGRHLAWLLAATLGALGASDPEVVKVRVPAAKVPAFFPAGTEIEVMPPDRFDELLKAVRDRKAPAEAPRILRANHSARLEAGVLTGRSELTVEPPEAPGSALVVLDPWSPALEPGEAGSKLFRATADGRLAVKVESPGPKQIEARWQLRGRPGSEGRVFSLALPDLEMASLVLDLPAGLVPEAKAGPRVGPEPGATPDRAIWRFESARGAIDLRLSNPAESAGQPGGSGLWVEGTTRVDLNQQPANWRADWTIEGGPGARQRLTIELDPGLDLVDVVGPRVASFREEPSGTSTRVMIKLADGNPGPSPLILRAICHVPVEGLWAIPSARPVDATWTGGQTLVTLDGARVLQACSERAGRRVAPRSPTPLDRPTLIFEGNGEAGPVAELTLRKPTADATVDIRGHLRLGTDVPRIDVALTWTVERGRLLTHAVDLPPGWTPERVLSSVKQPVPWHAEALGNGGTRVHLGPALPDENALMLTLTLSATAWKAGVSGPLELPRVRPTPGVRVVDEIWAATPDPILSLRPIKGEGLAWIDPLDPPLDDAPAPWVFDDLKNALAWRWLADDAEARIDRTWPIDRPRADVRLDATIRDGRLGLKWSLAVESDLGDLRSIPIHLDQPVGAAIRWRAKNPGGPVVEAKPIDDARRAQIGFPATGSAWDLELSAGVRGRVEVEATFEKPWSGRGRIPILTFPAQFRTQGLASVIVGDSTRVKVEAPGLNPIDPSSVVRDLADLGDEFTSTVGVRSRRAATFAYRSAGGRLEVETTELTAPGRGLIREASLVSQVFPGDGIRHRLTLRLGGDTGRIVTLKMPAGVTLDRIRRDGQPVVIQQAGALFDVEIPPASGPRIDSSLTIDYRTDSKARPESIFPASILPESSLPCLSFVWDLVTPDPWCVGEVTGGLGSTDPTPVRSATARLLGFHLSPWNGEDRAATLAAKAMLDDLDQVASEPADGETTLGDWLMKLDAGRWPVVVDRLALRSSGLGPGSRVGPLSAEGRELGPVRGVLTPLGLVAVPLGRTILITGRLEAPANSDERAAWSLALKQVPSQGSDPTDRFQSAPRWRAETTPRALAAGESLEKFPGPTGWHCRRLVALGWPESTATVRLVDHRTAEAWGWLVAAVILAGGILTRNDPARRRALSLLALGLVATVAFVGTWPEPPTWATGWLRGVLALSAFWCGCSFRPSSLGNSTSPIEPSNFSRRSSLLVRVVGAILIAVTTLGVWKVASGSMIQAEPPILALLVFDGPPDATSKPDRVILSIADANRLRRLAEPPTPRSPAVSLATASYQISRDGPRQAIVESKLDVEVEKQPIATPAEWSMPVGLARDLSAVLDGRPTPLRISADGRLATVSLVEPGTHVITFRRSLSIEEPGAEGYRLVVPINRSAFARLSVAPGPVADRVEIPSATGVLIDRAGELGGALGPVESLDVRWSPLDRLPITTMKGPVEATMLWDARPVGDLIRLRLAHGDPDGASTIRLALDQDLTVRGYSIPNVVSIRQEGTSERPEWVARVDPPVPKDTTIEVDLWRTATPGTFNRRWPLVEVIASGKVGGMVGFRRPVDWSGRLDPRPGMEAVSEANFVKAWGPLDDASLTFAGALRFGQPPTGGVAIRPIANRRSIATNVQIDLVPGRLNVAIDAILTDIEGRSFELELGLPNDLRLIRVEADGLVDWQKRGRERLRLQFDGSEVVGRRIRIEGSLPVPSDSVMTEARSYLARIPWPRWAGPELQPGMLVIGSPTRFQVDAGEGVVALPATGPAAADVPYRSTYRVDNPSGLATIRWSAPTARFGVSVRSNLTIDPGSMHWMAVVVCDIAGGPADSLQWNLPTEWTRNASLEVEGHPHRLVTETRGMKGETTHWTILPESPLWSRVRLVFRSQRPIEPGAQIAYPEIAPLAIAGRGSLERYELAVANLSGLNLKIEGLKGLQAVEVDKLRADDWPGFRGSIDHAYQVKGGRWSLGLRVGTAGDPVEIGGDSRPTKVDLANMTAVIGDDGETWGRARYDLADQPGTFLTFELPEPAEVPFASVDGLTQPVVRDGPGRWVVPLGDRSARRVYVLWRRPGSEARIVKPEDVVLPRLIPRQPVTVVTLFTPATIVVAPPSQGFVKLDRTAWEVESAELAAPGILKDLGSLDLDPTTTRERLINDLVDFEVRARSVSRTTSSPPGTTEPAVERIRRVIASIQTACGNAGLDDLFQEAQARLGLVRGFDDPSRSTRPITTDLLRTRRIGVPTYFRSREDYLAGSARFALTRTTPPSTANPAAGWAVAGVGVSLSVVGGFWVARSQGRPRRRVRVLLMLVAVLAIAWEPLGGAVLLVLACVGRRAA